MKILSFSYCFPRRAAPQWGIFVLQRLAAVARREHLQVVAPEPYFPWITSWRGWRGPCVEEWQGLRVYRPRFFYLPGLLKSFDGRFYARAVRRWWKAHLDHDRPDILDAHFEWPDAVGVSLLAREVGLPYAVTMRGWLYEAMARPRILPQCVEALRGAAAIISVSTHLAETAVQLGAPAERVHVIPNGVDTERFCPRDKTAARQALGLPEDGRLLVSVAHLGPRKGHRETIQALAQLPPDVRLVLVGGSPGPGRSEHALRELARRCGVQSRVIFAGRQPHETVPLFFNAADASVLASYREGCPNVVLESLASGTPVVASDVGNVSTMVCNGTNGFVVPPKTVGPLAAALSELLNHPIASEEVRRWPAVRSWDEVAGDACEVLGEAARLPQATTNGQKRVG
jgi:glycosyltransferase involved in cell wall biosynthesis